MKIIQSKQIVIVIFVLMIGIYAFKHDVFNKKPDKSASVQAYRHFIDRTGVIPSSDVPRFEQYMKWIMVESGVDMRFVFVPDTGGKSIETLAVDMMDQLQIGRSTGQERGLLLIYDMDSQRLKIEVGYGLEGWFTDAFVNYLVEDHARMFFSSGNLTWGLRHLLRLLQHRIREAVIGKDFDPRILEKIQPLAHLSGGAGVSKTAAIGDNVNHVPETGDIDPMSFPSGTSPEETYQTYLNWLSHWPASSQNDFLTPESRNYMAWFQASPAYASFILMGEYRKRFVIVERDDLALLYFTDTPFVSPHFFVRQNGQWRMDLIAEVRNTHEHVGGPLTWSYTGRDDNYTRKFKDLLFTIKGYTRFRDGDNTMLTIPGKKL
jgi:uncharacterized membrane protein YgcG